MLNRSLQQNIVHVQEINENLKKETNNENDFKIVQKSLRRAPRFEFFASAAPCRVSESGWSVGPTVWLIISKTNVIIMHPICKLFLFLQFKKSNIYWSWPLVKLIYFNGRDSTTARIELNCIAIGHRNINKNGSTASIKRRVIMRVMTLSSDINYHVIDIHILGEKFWQAVR